MRRTVVAAIVCVVFAALLPTPAPAAPILGGQLASEEYPFMVSVQTAPGGDHFCGGSLVAKKIVLTAAHCAQGEKPEGLQVMIGSHTLSDPGTVIGVKKIVAHEQYAKDETHDVALLYLKKAAKQKPIRLAGPTEKELWAPGSPSRVIGWGAEIFLVGPGSDDLKEVDVPVVDDADCARMYDNTFGFDPLSMVCAGETTGGKDSCQGDSGGPLMVRDDAEWIQMGVVSFGLGCGFPLFYGVYARVGDDDLRTWVQSRL
jgi:secreted trypsin-like serine protease